jgi:hypothetical protein
MSISSSTSAALEGGPEPVEIVRENPSAYAFRWPGSIGRREFDYGPVSTPKFDVVKQAELGNVRDGIPHCVGGMTAEDDNHQGAGHREDTLKV